MLVDDKQARKKLVERLRAEYAYPTGEAYDTDMLKSAADELESLSAQVAELKKDAERYRKRREEEWWKLQRALPAGESIDRETHALSYDAHSDWIKATILAAKESGVE